ncbi:MAG: Tol-Pal system beta propeller repeat protein TolB [Nevskia sp.]|jgi:TolB protein|nr:Tol-Pal system beta propeller repeat protein TolB [Nevskia sp.]
MKITKLAVLLIAVALPAAADLDITVSQGSVAKRPIAVVPFAQPAGSTPDFAQVIAADLDRSGVFRTLRREDMKFGLPTEENQVDYRTWRTLGQDHLVIGKVAAAASGSAAADAKLFDVYAGNNILNVHTTGARASDWRSMAHQIADQVFEKLTGIKGIFDTRIAYISATGTAKQRIYRLIWADADGENPREIARNSEAIFSPAWSPDGKKIAYVTFQNGRSQVVVQTPTTGQREIVASEKGINSAPAWTPDGTKLVVALSFETNLDLYLIDLATKSKKRLTDSYAIDTAPAVSPDGRTVAFLSDRSGSAQIYMMSIDGGEAKRLTFEGRRNEQPRFSPDGKTLALVNYDGSSYRIGLIDLQSAAMRLISDGPLDESPSFAPNGALVIYTHQGVQGAELATVSVDGNNRQQLRQTGDVREPAWAPYQR